jgi:electron transfer flavoprotein alpha subunit
MSNDIFVITEHIGGKVTDISYEMVGKAKELSKALNSQTVAVLLGSSAADIAGTFSSDATIYVDDPALEHFNPEAYGKVIERLVAERDPLMVMFGSTSMGMDLAAWLSVKSDWPCVAYVKAIELADEGLIATSQIYGGKMEAEVIPGDDSAILTILSGAFPAEFGRGATAAEKISAPVSLDELKTRFVEMIEPDAADIDITAQGKLVAIGRGIGSEDNVELAEELAEVLGAAVAASRPVTDAGWLPKTRQVGKSGLTVKPKLYLMLGISGAPEHLEGMKDAELIIAVNTDEQAPIFDVADYGTTEDLFDVAEAMLEMLE